MAPLPQRPDLRNARSNVRGAVHNAQAAVARAKPPGVAPAAALQAARERVRAVIEKIPGGRALAGDPLLQDYLETLLGGGPEADALVAAAIAQARAEAERRTGMLAPLSGLLSPFQSMQARRDFRRSVLIPARQRRLSSQTVWDAVDAFFAQKGPTFHVIRWAETQFGPMMISMGMGAEAGAGAGLEYGLAVAGLRHHCVSLAEAQTYAVGAYAELQGSFQIGVAPGKPESGLGLTLDVAGGLAYGVSGEITISMQPSLHRPSPREPWIVDYTFAGAALSLGVATPGGGAAVGLTFARSIVLGGIAQ